ncbi:signal peptidase I [Zafaria sp. Z1313]|uniref:signal peptidase I n=1 Tax=unclassified Zafaria TaxID=2828765 RepID=UPI002E760F5B|nr:signal peptidase I [Zafaria sp. J156]
MPVLLAAALVAVMVRATLVDFYYIESRSMEPTLAPGDGLLVDRTAADRIGRGDVVVFDGRGSLLAYSRDNATQTVAKALRLAGDDTVFVKRVIAVGGDTLSCCSDDGRIRLNGQPLDEPYLQPGDAPSLTAFDVAVPEGRIWVMGDHRSASADSRSLLGAPGGGMVPLERVIGRVERIVWPLERAAPLQREETE